MGNSLTPVLQSIGESKLLHALARIQDLIRLGGGISVEQAGEPVDQGGEESEAVIFVEMIFPFETRPDTLMIGGPRSARMAGIGFVVYHEDLPVNDFRYLSDA